VDAEPGLITLWNGDLNVGSYGGWNSYLIFYGATVATCSVSRAGLLSHAKPI